MQKKKLPTEILQEIIQYSDTLTRVTLGFPVDKEKLLEEGGPGKVLDEFLRRNGDLEYLKEWIPGECALTYGVFTKNPKKILEIDRIWNTNMFSNQGFISSVNIDFKWGMENINHDVEEPIQYFAITKQWEKIEKPIRSRQCHPKYLMDAPEDKHEKDTLMLLSLYKGGKTDANFVYLIGTCLFHKMYKEAVQIGEDNDHDIITDIILHQDVKALRHIGLSEREVQAHESLLDGYPNESSVWLDDKLEDDLYEKYYKFDAGLCYVLEAYHFCGREIDVLIEKAKWFDSIIDRVIVCDINVAIYYNDAIQYPDPPKATIYDIDRLSMFLFFWTKYGSESISIR